MKPAGDLIPWTVTDISIRPYDAMWSMNPSIHYDGQSWRCVLRCTDYAMPNGKTIRSSKARPAGNQTKNAMIVFDPRTWKPIQIFKMHERDDHPRTQCANVGYEDMRIFRTDRGGLQGIAATLHLERGGRSSDGGARNQPPEQALLSFDAEYNIVAARPIRGDWWSGMPQKNWVPFDDCQEPRFLYSIDKGTMFDDRGALHGDVATARPSSRARSLSANAQSVSDRDRADRERREREQQERARQEREAREAQERREKKEREREEKKRQAKVDPRTRLAVGGTAVSLVRGRRISHDVMTTRPSYAAATPRHAGTRVNTEVSRQMGTGRALPPKYEGLRGGSQLVRVGDDAWLGIAHEMRFDKGLKLYWHTWYLTDSRGKMKSASAPMKLAPEGIEFAAGLAIDGDRAVVSFGVDDMNCRLGETRLSAVMGILRPVA